MSLTFLVNFIMLPDLYPLNRSMGGLWSVTLSKQNIATAVIFLVNSDVCVCIIQWKYCCLWQYWYYFLCTQCASSVTSILHKIIGLSLWVNLLLNISLWRLNIEILGKSNLYYLVFGVRVGFEKKSWSQDLFDLSFNQSNQ